MKSFWFALLVAVAALVPGRAEGYHEIDSFGRSANDGGGAGSYYTGSPRYKGYDCRICHVESEGRIEIELGGDLTSGRYRPGLVYGIEVAMLGEHRGLDSAFNPNTFTLDVTDLDGNPVGELSASPGGIVETRDSGQVAVAEGFGNGESAWTLAWIAPSEPVQARLHIALLDGDGASDPVVRFIDPLNDDVATLTLNLCPEGQTCPVPAKPEDESSPAGCRTTRGSAPVSTGLLLMVALLAGFGRSRSDGTRRGN